MRIEIKVAVKNQKGEWETPSLDETEKSSIIGAIETIHRMGESQKKKSDSWNKFSKGGSVLEVTENGIFIEGENKQWNWLVKASDGLEKKTKDVMKKTLLTVGDFSRSKAREKIKSVEYQRLLSSHAGRGKVVIEVRVVPINERYKAHLENERQFHQEIQDKLVLIKNKARELEDRGISEAKRLLIENSLETLSEASRTMLDVMAKVDAFIADNKIPDALETYSNEFPDVYESFCQQMLDWKIQNRAIEHAYGDQPNPFSLDSAHLGFHESMAKELIPLDAQDRSRDLNQIVDVHQQYVTSINSIESASKVIANGQVQESEFLEKVQNAIRELNSEEFRTALEEKGWQSNEIDSHTNALEGVEREVERMVDLLKSAQEEIESGDIDAAKSTFIEGMQVQISDYTDAIEKLVIFQHVAKGRFMEMKIPDPLDLDLAHPEVLAAVLSGFATNLEEHESAELKDFADVAKTVKDSITDLEGSLKYHPSAAVFNEQYKQNLLRTRQLETFLEKYTDNRELFHKIMRAHGFSDLKTSLMFNLFGQLKERQQVWNEAFQNVVDAANSKEYQEAFDLYFDLLEEQYEDVSAFIEKLNYTLGIRDKKVVAALHRFLDLVGIKENKALFEKPLEPLWQATLEQQKILEYDQSLKDAVGKGFVENDRLERFEEMKVFVKEQAAHALQESETFKSFYKKDGLRFLNFFNYKNLMKKGDQKNLKTILDDFGWTPNKIENFSKVTNRFAEVIRPLKEAEEAILNEADPEYKRALQSQLKELAKQLLPKVHKAFDEYRKLGGGTQFRTLKEIAERSLTEVWEVESSEKLKVKLEQKYQEHPASHKAIGFDSPEELRVGLKEYISRQSDFDKSVLKQTYQDELKLIDQIAESEEAEGMLAEAETLIKTMEERLDFLKDLYETTGLATQRIGEINQKLLTGPHAKDPDYMLQLKNKGWPTARIQKFSSWYDAYVREYFLLNQAKKELEADPENLLLQKKLRESAKRHIPKLHALSKKFAGEFKSTEQLDQLVTALSEHRETLISERDRLQENLEGAEADLTKKTLKELINKHQRSIDMLVDVDFSQKVKEMDGVIQAINQASKKLMSWDKDVLHFLTSKRSPLLSVKPTGLETKVKWKELLVEHKLNEQDLKQVEHLHRRYQVETKKMMELERKLEAQPGVTKLRMDLMKEMKNKQAILATLDRALNANLEKIKQIDTALSDFNEHLKKYKNIDPSREELDRKVLFGGLSDKKIEELIELIDQLKVYQAFEEKRSFVAKLFDRFKL